MWILKGTVLGFLIFIVGWFAYFGGMLVYGFLRLYTWAKAGVHPPQTAVDVRGIIHSPMALAAVSISFLAAIAIGLWIVRFKNAVVH